MTGSLRIGMPRATTEPALCAELAVKHHPAIAAVMAYDLVNLGWQTLLRDQQRLLAVKRGTSWYAEDGDWAL